MVNLRGYVSFFSLDLEYCLGEWLLVACIMFKLQSSPFSPFFLLLFWHSQKMPLVSSEMTLSCKQ